LKRPRKSSRLFWIGVPETAHLDVALSAAIACAVEVL
jgi:hypothetical protein